MRKIFYTETEDGSYTARCSEEEQESTEFMHSQSGAMSETIYIYQPVVDYVLNNFQKNKNIQPVFVTVGLGLGYIEMMFAACLARFWENENSLSSKIILYSFETEEVLKNNFCHFIKGNHTQLTAEDIKAYQKALELLSSHYQIPSEKIVALLKKLYEENKLILCDALTQEIQLPVKAAGVFFDAFSAKSSPELWSSDFLNFLFSPSFSQPSCAFATYAARLLLTECLQNNKFVVEKIKGFGAKRESTFAWRQ